MEAEFLNSTEEQHFLYFIKHPIVLNKKKSKNLISDLEETIVELRASLKDKNVITKNGIYNKIYNREQQIKWANKFV